MIMKTLNSRMGFFQSISMFLARIFLFACALNAMHALAAPRASWVDLIPDFVTPLYHESFDEAFYWGSTNAQIISGNYTID